MREASRFSRVCSRAAKSSMPAQTPMLPMTANQFAIFTGEVLPLYAGIWTMTRFERCSMSLHRKLAASLNKRRFTSDIVIKLGL
jgi:hypothetical protein